MIDITGVDLQQFVKDVYDLSVPQGLGFFHAREGGLSDQDADDILSRGNDWSVFNMDYVHGRACKMGVSKKNGKLFINSPWYDHTDEQLQELLSRHNIDISDQKDHGISCECYDCKKRRAKWENQKALR